MTMKEYEELKSLLESLKKKINENITQLSREMNLISTKGEIEDEGDTSSIMSDKMDLSAMLKQQQDELDDVNYALSKFDLGGYGVCERTGLQIPIARLRVEPQARCVVGAE